MTVIVDFFLWLPVGLGVYAYAGYPALLRLVARSRATPVIPPEPEPWPSITITVPCYNEERNIRDTLERLLALDYPADRRHILVISDASTDRTDDIVREFSPRGVELLRLETRRGKSAAENAAGPGARGDIVVNTDATIRIMPHALKALVRAFGDPRVGVASGRDVSITHAELDATLSDLQAASVGGATSGESGYVGYEMGIRALETRVGSIVGASGCFYGIRRTLYDSGFPESLSRDFASALMVRELGYRAVSVDEALCLVPRTTTLQSEFRRKIRTMARGLQTLWYKRALLNPVRFGAFAWMLFSHKLCRWLVYPALPLAAIALAVKSAHSPFWLAVLVAGLAGTMLGVIGMRWPHGKPAPSAVTLAGFGLASNVAGVLAWVRVLRNQRAAVWEPTRRA
jgi:cellulose synthase/poly-beta-1,6-N-acetylglucosamine synthase-like glycosyltransferase